MKVTILGSGTSQGVPVIACKCDVCTSSDEKDKRLRSSILLQDGETNVVIDTGPDFRQQMLRVGLDKLDAVVFTHEHKDHIAGLDDIRGFNQAQLKDISIYADQRTLNAIKRDFYYAFAEVKYPGVPGFEVKVITEKTFSIGSIHFQPIRLFHYRLPIYGFRVKNFAYLTDVNYIPMNSLRKLKNLDVLVLDALRHEPHISHYTLKEALKVVSYLKPKQTYFTHISHLLGKHDEINTVLPENCKLAYDGLSLSL